MVAWFVIAIGTVALFAYIAIAGVTAVDTTGTNVSRAETIRRIDAVVATLSKRAASPRADGVVMIPAGVASTNSYLLPTDLQQVGRTSFGALFQYCPMGITLQDQNDTVNSPAGGAYGIQTVSLNGSAYVASGRAPILPAGDQNIFGFVIAPVSPGATVAGCNQITASGDGYVAPNSIVRAIRRSTTTNEDLTRGADAGTWYVTQEGGGNGSSFSSPSTLAAALEAYRVSTGGRFIVRFGPGTYTVAGSPLDQTAVAIPAKRTGSSLSFVSSSGSVLNLGRIYVPGDFEIRGMDARSNEIVSSEGHAVGVRNASVGPITLTGGSRLNIADNSAVFSNDANPATIQVLGGSTAQITNSLDLYYSTGKAVVLTDAGSSLNITSSYVNVRPASQQAGSTKSDSAFIIKTGSKFTVKSSTIDLNMSNEWAIMLGGSMLSSDSFINYNAYTWVGLQTQPGASANFAAVTFAGAQPARYTFATQSASNIVGGGNLYSTQRCWYRGQSSIHRLSPVGVAGDNSSVTPDEPARPMNGLPTAQQAADYQASQARNAERAELRSRMTVGAGFECKQAAPVTWVNCANNPGGIANENAYCTLPVDVGNVLVRYGINGTYNYRWSSNGILCDNATFNPDPVPGVVKGCSYAQ
jgi:hypothetical protein